MDGPGPLIPHPAKVLRLDDLTILRRVQGLHEAARIEAEKGRMAQAALAATKAALDDSRPLLWILLGALFWAEWDRGSFPWWIRVLLAIGIFVVFNRLFSKPLRRLEEEWHRALDQSDNFTAEAKRLHDAYAAQIKRQLGSTSEPGAASLN